MVAAAPRTRKPRSRYWFILHGWLALPIWVLLFFVCVTGTISVVSHEIVWLVDSRVRATNPADSEPVGFDLMADAVRAEYPGAAMMYVNQRAPYLATSFFVGLPDAPYATAYVNQYTGEVQGMIRGITFPEFMRSLHGWLLLPWDAGTSIGYYLVGFLGVIMIALLVTGFMVHKRVFRTLHDPILRRNRGARVWWGDVHRLLGAWSIWFVASVGLTGIWFLTQGILWDAEIPFEPFPEVIARGDVPVVQRGSPPPKTLGFDAAIAAARTEIPDLQVKWLYAADGAFSPVTVLGKQSFPLISDYAAAAQVNPYSGEVMKSRTVGELSAVGIIDNVADPLHYGSFGGLWSRAVWVLFGLALSTLVFSGMLVWMKRTARATFVPQEREAPALSPLAEAMVE